MPQHRVSHWLRDSDRHIKASHRRRRTFYQGRVSVRRGSCSCQQRLRARVTYMAGVAIKALFMVLALQLTVGGRHSLFLDWFVTATALIERGEVGPRSPP